MSVNFYTGANQVIVKNTLTDELKTNYDDAVELVNKLGGDATVEGSVAQRIATIVANAPEKYDTLKEIATWIESDTDGAAKMQADIATLEADKLDKTSVSSWAKASTKPDYTASEINMANGTSVESTIGTMNTNLSRCPVNKWCITQNISVTGEQTDTVTIEDGSYIITQTHPFAPSSLYLVTCMNGYTGKVIAIIEDTNCTISMDNANVLSIKTKTGGGNFRWWHIIKLCSLDYLEL